MQTLSDAHLRQPWQPTMSFPPRERYSVGSPVLSRMSLTRSSVTPFRRRPYPSLSTARPLALMPSITARAPYQTIGT